MQHYIEVDEGDWYTLKINCKRKRTVGKANKGINVEKIIIGLKIKIKWKMKDETQTNGSYKIRQIIIKIIEYILISKIKTVQQK